MALCEHLRELEDELIAQGITIHARGQFWSRNCREWITIDAHLDCAAIRTRLRLDPCVEDHENTDPRSGTERGLVCSIHHDAVVGTLAPVPGKPIIR